MNHLTKGFSSIRCKSYPRNLLGAASAGCYNPPVPSYWVSISLLRNFKSREGIMSAHTSMMIESLESRRLLDGVTNANDLVAALEDAADRKQSWVPVQHSA